MRGQRHLLKSIHRRKPGPRVSCAQAQNSGAAGAGASSVYDDHHRPVVASSSSTSTMMMVRGGRTCEEVGESAGQEVEFERLMQDKDVLMLEVLRLRNQLQSTHNHLDIMWDRLQATERHQHQMLTFLAKGMHASTTNPQYSMTQHHQQGSKFLQRGILEERMKKRQLLYSEQLGAVVDSCHRHIKEVPHTSISSPLQQATSSKDELACLPSVDNQLGYQHEEDHHHQRHRLCHHAANHRQQWRQQHRGQLVVSEIDHDESICQTRNQEEPSSIQELLQQAFSHAIVPHTQYEEGTAGFSCLTLQDVAGQVASTLGREYRPSLDSRVLPDAMGKFCAAASNKGSPKGEPEVLQPGYTESSSSSPFVDPGSEQSTAAQIWRSDCTSASTTEGNRYGASTGFGSEGGWLDVSDAVWEQLVTPLNPGIFAYTDIPRGLNNAGVYQQQQIPDHQDHPN